MKQLVSVLLLVSFVSGFGQEDTKPTSFLTKNQPIELFSNTESLLVQKKFDIKLPSEFTKDYQSDLMNFVSNDTRLINYPSADLTQLNDVVFGSYMSTTVDIGNTKLNTYYIFDYTGRMVNSSASFSFGKKKK